jgi:hypothetical protein
MRTRETLRLLFGSTAVYLVVAACSASGGNALFGTMMDGGTEASSPGKDGGHPKPMPIKDVVTDPVKEAMADDNASGTRLKATRYVGEDNSSIFLGLYDSMLHTPCTFTQAFSDGSTRCMPTGPTTTSAGTFFADSGCTQPLATIPACTTALAPTYATLVVPAACDTLPSTSVYSVMGAWTGLIYLGTPAACTMAKTTDTMPYSFFSVGATELSPSMFVKGTYTIDP